MNYGTVAYHAEKQVWMVKCQPHVSMRLKRVFAQLGKRAQGVYTFSDTPLFARDFLWFMSRYPMEMKQEHREYMALRAKNHREQLAVVEKLRAGELNGHKFELVKPARDYQKVAAAMWLTVGGLLLADEVGVGKTISALAALTDPATRPCVVVCLTHLPSHWAEKLTEFAPQLSYHIVKKGTPYDVRGKRRKTDSGLFPTPLPDVLIINYHKLAGWAETLVSWGVRSVIFDEIQELRRGPGSAKYGAAQWLATNCKYKLGASATPIFNYGGEFFHVLNVLRPDSLGTWGEFLQEWCGGHDGGPKVSVRDPKAFGSFLQDNALMIRRTRKDVGRELPPLTKVPYHIDADQKALDQVSASCAELARVILSQGPQAFKGERMMAAEEFNVKLRQATGIAKAPYVAEFVKMLIESGESVLLGGWHREVYSIWLDRLKEYDPVMYTGTESPKQKDESRQAFLTKKTPLMIMSLRAGQGIDGLQHVCKTVVKGELDWSPAVHDQFDGRIARDGQAHPVMSYYLIADSGSDPIIADVLGLKRQQSQPVLDPNLSLVEKLSIDPNHIRSLAERYLNTLKGK